MSKIDFSYGVLYGTKRVSNKKDWHVLRDVDEKIRRQPTGKVVVGPDDKWHCVFRLARLEVTVTVRIGIELWNYIAGAPLAFMELATALIRACVAPSDVSPAHQTNFTIADMADIIGLDVVPSRYNVSILPAKPT